MSHQTRARSRNAQHAIADKQHKQQQTSNTRQSRTQPTNKQPRGTPRCAQQNALPETRKPPQPHQPGTATGASRHRIRNQRHHTQQPHPTRGACSLAARNSLVTAQPQAKGNHHGHTPTRWRAHPDDAESRPNMAETRKREKPTPRPPEQRRGKPQQAEAWTPADSRGLEPHPHNVSEPLSRRTQRPRGITVQNRGNKTANTKRTQDAQQNPRTNRHKKTHPAAAPTTGLHAPMSATTRAHTHPYSTVLFPPVPVAGLEPARPTGHPLLRRACLPFHHTGIVSAPPLSAAGASTSGGTRTHTPHGHLILSQTCLPIPSRRQNKRGAETNTRDNHATTMRPTGGTHTSRTISQPNPRARTLSTGPPRPAQLTHQHREHPSANTQAPPAHTQRTIQCRHTPQRDSTRSRERPRVVSAPRSA